MWLTLLPLVVFCFCLSLSIVRCQTDVGTNVKTNFCPKYNYVSRVEFNKSTNNLYDVTVECHKFEPSTAAILGQEECTLRLPFPLQGYTLLWNDYLRNCRCNEYIAGIKHYDAGWDGKAAISGGTKTKLIQLQCCWSSNKEQNPPSCIYSGMENLQSPWGSSSMGVREGEMQSGHNFAIQSFVIREGNINARICDFKIANNKGYSWPSSGIHGCWSGVDYDCSENSDQGGICYDKSTSLFSWNEAMTYDSNNAIATIKTGNKQLQICRSGYRMTGLTKSVTNDAQGKGYQFTIKCSPMSSRSCYCVWLPKCPTDEFFGSSNNWHVTGIRSAWDSGDKDLKLEVLCCHVHSMIPGTCKPEELKSDTETTFDLKDKLYQFPLKSKTPLRVVTNIETFYDNGVLNMRFNVCSAVYNYDWCYSDPCYWCRSRAYRDGVPVGGSGYWSAQDAGYTSSSMSSGKSLSNAQMADSSYWNSWSGWSSSSGNWGAGCGGLPLTLIWLPSLANPFRGSWSSWNSWHRSYNTYDDSCYSSCPSCYRATTISRWSKWSRSSNGRSAWSAAGGSVGAAKSRSWSDSRSGFPNNGGSKSSSSRSNSGNGRGGHESHENHDNHGTNDHINHNTGSDHNNHESHQNDHGKNNANGGTSSGGHSSHDHGNVHHESHQNDHGKGSGGNGGHKSGGSHEHGKSNSGSKTAGSGQHESGHNHGHGGGVHSGGVHVGSHAGASSGVHVGGGSGVHVGHGGFGNSGGHGFGGGGHSIGGGGFGGGGHAGKGK